MVKLVDFGLARKGTLENIQRVGERSSLMAGTPEYLSPEQAMGQAATPRSDLYSVGVMLFELLTGRLPFEDEGVTALLDAHIDRPAPLLHTVVGGMPESLEQLVDSLLAKAPDARPASADIARTTVQRVIRELRGQETNIARSPLAGSRASTDPTLATRPDLPPVSDTQQLNRSNRSLVVVASLITLALVAGVVVLARQETTTLAVAPEPVAEPSLETTPKTAELAPVEVVATPPPPQPTSDDIVPISTAVKTLPKKSSVPPKSAPVPLPPLQRTSATQPPPIPAVCSRDDWRNRLRDDLGQAEHAAVARGRFTDEAKGALKVIHVALRGETASCDRLARDLDQWRARYTGLLNSP